MAELLFWIAVCLIGYSYGLYPIIVAVWARIFPVNHATFDKPAQPAVAPDVACLVSAFNEERDIEARIKNIKAQTYDHDKLTLYVGSDGSKDRTAELIRKHDGDRVRAFVFEQNRGKATVLNELVDATSEPILVFSDANTEFEPDAVAQLVKHFSNPRIGAVCGQLQLRDAQGSNKDSTYWRIEQFLKQCESKIGGLLGANGSIYALRRDLYRPLAPDIIVDDFCIVMTAAAEGWTIVHEPKAIAHEETPDEISEEYHRRVRIGTGNYQALFRHPEYILKTNWPTRFSYLSHKVLRWLTPLFMLIAFIASAWMAFTSQFYFALFALQLATYCTAGVISHFKLQSRLPSLLAFVYYFLTLNWAFLVAFIRYLTGHYSGSWRRTMRADRKSDEFESVEAKHDATL